MLRILDSILYNALDSYISRMKQTSNFGIFLLLSLCLFSCGRDFYVPNPSNLLVLEEKKDFKANLSINSAQVAYSPFNGVGLKGDFAYVRSRNTFGERNLNIGTLGIGYYSSKKIEPLFKLNDSNMRRPKTPAIGFDIFANVSLGRINTNNNTDFQVLSFLGPPALTNNFRSDIYKPNVSGQIFWKSRTFTLNFGVRYSYINFFNGLAFGDFDEFELQRAGKLISDSPSSNVEYDIKVSNGNNQISSFLALSWNQKTSLLQDNNSSFAFGLDVNISNFCAERKARKNFQEEEPAKKKKKKKRRKR